MEERGNVRLKSGIWERALKHGDEMAEELLDEAVKAIGTGVASAVLGATVATRWFTTRRGLVLGLFGAATSAGQMIFTPALLWLVDRMGWRGSVVILGIVALVILTPVFLLMQDSPADLGLEPFGGPAPQATGSAGGMRAVMSRAVRVPDFWLLAGSFFICGASSNGVIGVHFIPHSIDHGIPEVTAAGALALMGAMNFIGTIASGWLTDRYSSRYLLFGYYTLRGLSLLYLPFTLESGAHGLGWFAIFYGLDWVATVPPTVRLTGDTFGRENTGVIYGWIGASHQLGASLAAFGAGAIRTGLGDYSAAFWIAGAMCAIAGLSFLTVGRRTFVTAAASPRLEPALQA
jgi:sugar phosphate permease